MDHLVRRRVDHLAGKGRERRVHGLQGLRRLGPGRGDARQALPRQRPANGRSRRAPGADAQLYAACHYVHALERRNTCWSGRIRQRSPGHIRHGRNGNGRDVHHPAGNGHPRALQRQGPLRRATESMALPLRARPNKVAQPGRLHAPADPLRRPMSRCVHPRWPSIFAAAAPSPQQCPAHAVGWMP